MKKGNLIIIGKNSFIGSSLYNFLRNKKKIKILSFIEFMNLDKKIISNYDYVCNCAVNKNYIKKNHNLSYDYDLIISKKIKEINVNYIFLSSRKVYKPGFNITEKNKIQPIDKYSKNKLVTEKLLKKYLKSKLLILRISNVIGFKRNKSPRKVHKTFFDNYLNIMKKKGILKFHDLYKDFISIDQLSRIFDLILQKKYFGTYNVSLGQKVYMSEILDWLNCRNRNKDNIIWLKNDKKFEKKHSFTLNNKKIYKKIKYMPKKTDLKKFCIKLSNIIHKKNKTN